MAVPGGRHDLHGAEVVVRASQRGGDLRQPAVEPGHDRLGDEVVLGAEVVGDRGEVGAGLVGDGAGGDPLGRKALQASQGAVDQLGPVAALWAHGVNCTNV